MSYNEDLERYREKQRERFESQKREFDISSQNPHFQDHHDVEDVVEPNQVIEENESDDENIHIQIDGPEEVVGVSCPFEKDDDEFRKVLEKDREIQRKLEEDMEEKKQRQRREETIKKDEEYAEKLQREENRKVLEDDNILHQTHENPTGDNNNNNMNNNEENFCANHRKTCLGIGGIVCIIVGGVVTATGGVGLLGVGALGSGGLLYLRNRFSCDEFFEMMDDTCICQKE